MILSFHTLKNSHTENITVLDKKKKVLTPRFLLNVYQDET